jgi:hypothetical protein
MIDSVIITVRNNTLGTELDMELPAVMAIYELKKRLLDTLKAIDWHTYGAWSAIGMIFTETGNELADEDTLESATVWDGSIINIIKK